MNHIKWAEDLGVAVTVSDTDGKIVYLNRKSAAVFSKYGGSELEGRNLKDCHKPDSWEKISDIMAKENPNCYTIEKEGVKKLIYQAPWYDNGKLAGVVELSMEIPFEMDHFIRK
jgi:transcriptional regulator with PAS, ATPase and Fis domain